MIKTETFGWLRKILKNRRQKSHVSAPEKLRGTADYPREYY